MLRAEVDLYTGSSIIALPIPKYPRTYIHYGDSFLLFL